MPYLGSDPFNPGQPIDVSGGGYDPSAYYGLSPGGRFPGDVANYLDYLLAQSRGTAGGNPSYDVPDALQNLPGSAGNMLRRLLGAHERNARAGGEGQSPDLPAGQPHNFFSGPAASYGPPGGPLHGAVDIDRPGIWDGPEDLGAGRVESGVETGRGGRGGGGGGGVTMGAFQSPGQLTFNPSFVGWSPLQQGQSSSSLGVGPSSLYGESGRVPPSTTPRGAGGPGTGGGTGRGGSGSGGLNPRGQTRPPSSRPTDPPASTSVDRLLELLKGPGSQSDYRMTASDLRGQQFGGVDMGNIDRGTPSWLLDPTTRIGNAGGFPNATPKAPTAGQSFESYLDTLHQQGFNTETIGNFLSGYGYQRSPDTAYRLPVGEVELPGQWGWGWGTGPVVRGENGYQFARDAVGDGGGGAQSRSTAPDPRVWEAVLRR